MARIIAVDDVEDACLLLKKILERKGHEVFTFTDEDEAIEFASQNPVELAILDIKLKRMIGVELLAELRKILPSLKAVMLTGYPSVETARDSLEKGASEYLVKPVDKHELEETVEAILKEK